MDTVYKRSQKIFHWLLAVLILFWLFVSGEIVSSLEGSEQATILMFHSGGATIILLLMMARLRLRLKHPVGPQSELKVWEKNWGSRVHIAFYALAVLMFLSGMLQGVFFEQDVRVFGLVNITIGHKEPLLKVFHEAHEIIAVIFKLMIAIHILAALKHQFVDKLPFLKRMT
jgi:cytochrome b561